MPVFINTNGVWKELDTPFIKIDGVQKTIESIFAKVNGEWKEVLNSANECIFIFMPHNTAQEINEGLECLGRLGGGVGLFTEGEFELSDYLMVRHSNIELIGVKNLTTLRCQGKFSSNGIIDIRGTASSVLENICINGFTIDGNRANGGTSMGVKCGFVGGNNLQGAKIINCVIRGNSNNSIYLESTSNSTIASNIMHDNYSYSVRIFLSLSKNNTITGNIMKNNSSNGIYLALTSNNTIAGNNMLNNYGTGIYLESTSNNIVTGNIVQNNAFNGIYLYSSSGNTVTGNTVQNNNSSYGVYLNTSSNNNTVTGNTVQNNSSYGIRLNQSNNNVVASNISVKNGTSQLTDNGTDNLVVNNITTW